MQLRLLLLLLLLCSICNAELRADSKLCKSLYITNKDYVKYKNATRLQQQLKQTVAGCEYVHGDLVLQQLGTDSSTGQQLEGDIGDMPTDFLDSIVEVTGSVVLDQIGLHIVQFRSLRAIRGYGRTSEDPYSLQINQCPFMQKLLLPKLAAIAKGDAVLRSAVNRRLYCRLAHSVNWTLTFQSPSQRFDQKSLSFYEAGKKIKESELNCSSQPSCSSSCRRSHCWTEGDGACQVDSRCFKRRCNACFVDAATGEEECCDRNCLGGCSSRDARSCFACQMVSSDGECIRQCPDGFGYDTETSKRIKIGPAMVQVGGVCLKSCPAPFVTDMQRRYCLAECPTSQIAIGGNCSRCAASGEACTTCKLQGRSLTDSWNANGSCPVLSTTESSYNIDGSKLNESSLLALQTVRVIQAPFIMFKRIPLSNLTFLRNLRYVSGKLVLMQFSASYLGLAKLQAAGEVTFFKLSNLCKAWYPSKFLAKNSLYKFVETSVSFNDTSEVCAAAKCDPQCESECWGPGPELCVTCRNVSVDGVCYESCANAGRYSAGSECAKCHSLCSGGCSGPGPANCSSCSSFIEDGVCVAACSREMRAGSDRVCYSPAKMRLALVLVGCGLVLLVLVGLLLLGCWQYRRRMNSYEYVDLDECLSNPKNPSDLVQLLVVNDDDISKQKEIGSGTFGTVFKGKLRTHTNSGLRELPVAIKVLRGKNPKLGPELLSEASLLARVRHHRCIRLVALCMTDEVQLITALMPRGCLLDFVKSHAGRLSATRMLNWALQVAEGMSYLESMGIIHRDLAARNVLLRTPDEVKITDFGLAKLLNESEFTHTDGLLPVKWLGIECFESGAFSHKSDVWSYGVLLWEICSYGESPYKPYRISSVQDITDILKKGIRLAQPKDCCVDFYNIMLTCWLPQPESRPSFADLMSIMKDCLLSPESFIASRGVGTPDDDDDFQAADSPDGVGAVQLRSQQRQPQQQQQQQQQQQADEEYTPMSQVENDNQVDGDRAAETVTLLKRSKPNRYVSDPSDAKRRAAAESRRAPLGESEDDDDFAEVDDDDYGGRGANAAGEEEEVGYLQPISSAKRPAAEADAEAANYLQPRSLVTSQPVDPDEDYLAPNNC